MRIGLAVEGGGMKGVISAGACGEIGDELRVVAFRRAAGAREEGAVL